MIDNAFRSLAQDFIEASKRHPLYENVKKTKGKIVFGRGQAHAPEYLFIGEAPGFDENRTGKPFVGKSGKLLDEWLKNTHITSYAVVNAVPMIPLDSAGHIRAPTDLEIDYFRPYILKLIKYIRPKRIVCLGKTSAKLLHQEHVFRNGEWNGKVGFIYHPAFYLRIGQDGIKDFARLIKNSSHPEVSKTQTTYATALEYHDITVEDAINRFLKAIGGKRLSKESFQYNSEQWFINFHPFEHSDDIIVEESNVNKYEKFLLVKHGGNRVRIPGWTDKARLLSTPKVDIYRNGTYYHIVYDANVFDLTPFKIPLETKTLKQKFIINQQTAENLGHTEMISGILAGLHFFAKQAGVYFKDINQYDECILGDKKVKIYTRDAFSDEDMLIYESYYKKHPEIDIYVCCHIKGGFYNYVGYINKPVVDQTRVVQMIGQDSQEASGEVRRIFSDQYGNLSDYLRIYETEQKNEEAPTATQSYVPLHCHSEYSVGDAFGSTKYIVETLYKKGFRACALTDHGTLAGLWEFQKNMLEKNLKPILGCEIYVKLADDERKYHLTVLVKDKTGWENLLKIHSIATREHFHYKPMVMLDDLFKYKQGLVVLSGCSSSLVHTLIRNGKLAEAKKILAKFKQEFSDDFYAEIQPHKVKETDNERVTEQIYKIAGELGIKCVLTTDSHYPKAEDKECHEAIKAISEKKGFGEAGFGDDCFFLMEDKDFEKKITQDHWCRPYYIELLKVTNEIADKCNFQIEVCPDKDTLPDIDFPDMPRAEKFKRMCIEGLEKNTPYKYEGKIKERLDLEIQRFLDKKYENYFLIVADMIAHAKKSGIMCGPGRGSVGASLVAYALNITECDPIQYDLLFDRFVSVIRKDAPDIDMDFMDTRRDEIFEYLEKKYGSDRCARVVTYARFHPKAVLRDMGRIFKIPLPEIEAVCKLAIVRASGDARSSFSLTDTFSEFVDAKTFANKYPQATRIAMRLEGHIRHRGIHAGAMVVSKRDISTYVPITRVGGLIATEWEKQLVEDMNLVKFDILGLRTLTIIDDCIKSANVQLPKTFDDENVYNAVFKQSKTIGIFQFNTVGMAKFLQTLNVSCFQDLYDATTLFRPGALHSGQAMLYANRKSGKEKVDFTHPILEPITKDTRGIILYQEQIMQIMYYVGAMSWATAEMARKVITKSKGKDAFNKVRKEFVTNANRIHGMATEEAERLYDVVCTFGSYSFNKAHAVEYSMISYWCAWLKTYYPLHFYKSILKYEQDKNVIQDIIQEASQLGIEIEYPDINKSSFSYEMADGKIYAGLNSIEGIGESVAQKIIKHRPYRSVDDFRRKCNVSEEIFKGLIVADAFRSFNINKKDHFQNRRHGLAELYSHMNEKSDREDFSQLEWATLMCKYTSLKPKANIFQMFNFGSYPFIDIRALNENFGNTQQFIRGIVTKVVNEDRLIRSDVDKHIHRFPRHMIYLNLNDGTGNIACQINPATYEKYASVLQIIQNQPIIVYGILSKDGRKMYVDMIQLVDESNRTHDIDNLFGRISELETDEAFITSAQPAVSKKGNSFYRLRFHNGEQGLLFKLTDKLFPGMKVSYKLSVKPFIDYVIIKDNGFVEEKSEKQILLSKQEKIFSMNMLEVK